MNKSTVINHTKGQKHTGKTDWSKVSKSTPPVKDPDNPELASSAEKKFYKPESKKS